MQTPSNTIPEKQFLATNTNSVLALAATRAILLTIRKQAMQPPPSSFNTSQQHIDQPLGARLDLDTPECVSDLAFLTCFRGRKFARGRFAKLVSEQLVHRGGVNEALLHLCDELLCLFLAREMRCTSEPNAVSHDCLELGDGGCVEFDGDYAEAAEAIARAVASSDEARWEHLVRQVEQHSRSWLHTLAAEARDARLAELGLGELDDPERLFLPWHRQLLLRKLLAWQANDSAICVRYAQQKVSAQTVLSFLRELPEPWHQRAVQRVRFIALCQLVYDCKRDPLRMSQASMHQSAITCLEVLAAGVRCANGQMGLVAGPQVAFVYRLGLANRNK